MKRLLAMFIATSILFSTPVYAWSDARILSDSVASTYSGRTDAIDMITNLNFTDLEPGALKEAVVRAGALNIIKGYANLYKPDEIMTKEEVIAAVIRAMGQENEAQQAAPTANFADNNSSLSNSWSAGYLTLASQLGLITPADLNSALANIPTIANQPTFVRTAPAAREETASWIYLALTSLNPDAFPIKPIGQTIYTYDDWEDIDVLYANAVENLTSNGIMNGRSDSSFSPKAGITRGEMAETIKNMDSLYFKATNITKKKGTVGATLDSQFSTIGENNLVRAIYIRNDEGNVDKLEYTMVSSDSAQGKNKDAVVYKDGNVTSLAYLSENDAVEYLVNENNEILYVNVLTSQPSTKTLEGTLQDLNLELGTISIMDKNNKIFTLPIIEGLLGSDIDSLEKYLYINNKKITNKNIPLGSKVNINIKNSIANEILFVGEEVLLNEFQGVVTENNVNFGYLVVVDNTGKSVTMNYTDNNISVEKTPYYMNDDEIGYYNQMFPNFKYDPRTTVISQIEAGDIVFIRPYSDNPSHIESISATPNYTMKYGKVKEFTPKEDIVSVLLEYENGQTEWFNVPKDIFVSSKGKSASINDIKPGDWTRILVNQAIVGPGRIISSIKEINIEGDGHLISNIVKGQISLINPMQKKLIIQNSETLNKNTWSDYKNIAEYSIDGADTEFYNNNERIPLEYANKFLKNNNNEVYIALENNFSGEKVKKVTFRTERDELLPPDTVLNTNPSGSFSILGNKEPISTDSGTIIRKDGRLVDSTNLTAQDYALISLNGNNKAAVIDITTTPSNSGLMIVRGRIQSVDEGRSFTVQSMAILAGEKWNYTPIPREFKIDYTTLFLNGEGYVDSKTFLDYTDTSVVNKVFDIVVDGSAATHVIESPYPQKALKGTIYEITDTQIKIKDATYLDNETGKWETISNKNNVAVIDIPKNTVIAKTNSIVSPKALQIGDKLKIMTDTLPEKIESGLTVPGYIIYIEN